MKKVLSIMLVLSMALSLAACGGAASSTPASTPAQSGDNSGAAASGSIKVAAVSNGYSTAYPELWNEIAAAFEAKTGIKVELTQEQELEDVIGPAMQGGEFPDVVYLPTDRPKALTDQFIKDNLLTDITDVMSMTIPGEEGTVADKLLPGFLETSKTNPYSDGKTYLAPMHYDPCGLFYNAGLFKEKNWEVPTTWDEMWELGEKAKAEGIALFTYPSAGYFDAFLYSLMYSVGGPEFFDKATHYEEGIWETEEAKTCFAIIEKLASYTNEVTPAQANDQDFTKNQQLVLDNKALFMPNGSWVVNEMADAPRADGFEWGMMALPAVEAGKDRYSFCWFQQAWIPVGAENVDAAKQFIAYLYSDEAIQIFLKGGAVQPVKDLAETLDADKQMFYSIYDDAKAAMGGFAPYNAEAGLGTTREVFLDPINGLVNGNLSMDDYVKNIVEASDKMRANLK